MLKSFRFWQIAVSVLGLGFMVVHLLYPAVAIDSTTVTLLVVILLPWLLPYVRNIELPGGFKVELKEEIQSLKERLEKKGILLPPGAPPRLSQLKTAPGYRESILKEWGQIYTKALEHIGYLDEKTKQELWNIDTAVRRYAQGEKK